MGCAPTVILMLITLVGCSKAPLQAGGVAAHLVATSSGLVPGGEMTPGVILWQDIPYAQPPVGELRWRAPRALPASTDSFQSGDGSVAYFQKASLTYGIEGHINDKS